MSEYSPPPPAKPFTREDWVRSVAMWLGLVVLVLGVNVLRLRQWDRMEQCPAQYRQMVHPETTSPRLPEWAPHYRCTKP